MNDQRLTELFQLCMRDRANAAEREEFVTLMNLKENELRARELIRQSLLEQSDGGLVDKQAGDAIFNAILNADKNEPVIRSMKYSWLKYAAAVVLALTAALYFWPTARPKNDIIAGNDKIIGADIVPGTKKAILTLSNGEKIELDNTAGGIISDGNITIKNNTGELVYDKSGVVAENTMTTPKGGQYTLVLADGTRVWLNAASSITYPTAFKGDSREVQITGEAYFDVAHNPQKPFRVFIQPGLQVEVLGTQFNINAYPDEGTVATALIEGAVNVKANAKALKLIPGQLAEVARTGPRAGTKISVTDNAPVEAIAAWKTGVFNFNNKSLESIMRQLSRWYDIEVIYSGKIPDKQFWGEMGMDLKLEDVLQFLEKSNVKFTYQKGRKLIVGP